MSTAVSIVRTLLGLLFDHTIGNIVRMIPIIRLFMAAKAVSMICITGSICSRIL